jgi:hypothetical protein
LLPVPSRDNRCDFTVIMATIILGSQWGDEGKGKLTDILCPKAQICARAAVSLDEVNWTCAGC